MAIRMRRGNLADFDPTKQLSGEFGVSIDNSAGNQKVFMAFGNGNVKELMTVEDAEAQIGELVDDAVDAAIGEVIDTATEAAETATTAAQTATTQAGTATTKAGEAASSASSASTDATSAAGSAASADDSAEDSEAWAVGQRDGQDVPTTDETYHNNAKYWAEQASQAAGGGVTSFNGRSGSVSPQSGDYTAAMVGLGNVDNTSDLNKPISTATQTALNGKADTSALTDGSVTKIGTGNVGSATQPVYINGGVPTTVNYNISVVSQADSTIETLVTQIKTKAVTLSSGAYSFFGSWNSHSNGYQAAVVKGEESATFWKVSGTVYEYAQGRVWTFIDTYNPTTQAWSGAKIRQIYGITTGNATLNSTYIDSGSVSYVKSGNVVVVNMDGVHLKANVPTGTTLFSNLPQNAISRNRLWIDAVLDTTHDNFLCNMTNSGILALAGAQAMPTGRYLYGSFTYITND